MLDMILGLLGVVLGAGIFIAGYWFGRKTIPEVKPVEVPKQGATPEEEARLKLAREQLAAEQKAFSDLMSYNVSDAYGLRENPLERDRT